MAAGPPIGFGCAQARVGVLSAMLLSLCGCDGLGSGAAPEQGEFAGAVVSTVNGEAITQAEVERVAAATGWTASKALRRLQAQLLLAQEARRLGYDEDPEVVETLERARVQALWAAEIEDSEVSDADLAEFYEHRKEQYMHGELRRAVHVVANLARDESRQQAHEGALAFAERATVRFRAADDPKEVLAWAKQQQPPADAHGRPLFKLVPEELPPVSADGPFVKEFTDALFALGAVGDVAGPVKTIYGWHAIYLAEIVPPLNRPLAEVADGLRQELRVHRRPGLVRERTDALLKESGARPSKEGLAALGEIPP